QVRRLSLLREGQSPCLFLKGVTPVQTRKAAEISISRYPLTTAFYRQCCKKSIRDKVPSCAGRFAQVGEDCPVAISWHHDHCIWLLPDLPGESQGVSNITGRSKHAGMRHNTQETAQDNVTDCIGSALVYDILEPCAIGIVIRRVGAMRVNEHVDVTQYHRLVPSNPEGLPN